MKYLRLLALLLVTTIVFAQSENTEQIAEDDCIVGKWQYIYGIEGIPDFAGPILPGLRFDGTSGQFLFNVLDINELGFHKASYIFEDFSLNYTVSLEDMTSTMNTTMNGHQIFEMTLYTDDVASMSLIENSLETKLKLPFTGQVKVLAKAPLGFGNFHDYHCAEDGLIIQFEKILPNGLSMQSDLSFIKLE